MAIQCHVSDVIKFHLELRLNLLLLFFEYPTKPIQLEVEKLRSALLFVIEIALAVLKAVILLIILVQN